MVTRPDLVSTSRTTPARGYVLVEGLGPLEGDRAASPSRGALPPQPANATRARPKARFLRREAGGGEWGIIAFSHDIRGHAGSKGDEGGGERGSSHQRGNES